MLESLPQNDETHTHPFVNLSCSGAKLNVLKETRSIKDPLYGILTFFDLKMCQNDLNDLRGCVNINGYKHDNKQILYIQRYFTITQILVGTLNILNSFKNLANHYGRTNEHDGT